MSKTINLHVNIPSEFLILGKTFNEFVDVKATVTTQDDSWLVVFNSMTFRGCMAFHLKPEMYSKFADMLEDMCIREYAKIKEQNYYHSPLLEMYEQTFNS